MSHSQDEILFRHQLDLDRVLADANHLLIYAVEAGIEVDGDVAQRILAADVQGASFWGESEAGALLATIATLASKLHPVTAETLSACREEARGAIRNYKRVVYFLAVLVIPISMISFINTGISSAINSHITTANALTLDLHTKLATRPEESISALQQLAIHVRAIQSRANQLNHLVGDLAGKQPHLNVELPADLKPIQADVEEQVIKITSQYQDVRLFATNVLDATSIFWGAVVSCILPVLYALLGACAAVLRAFTLQTANRTFAYSYATPARFIIAAIGGGVIGLFNFTIGEGLTPSPLALAFLVGYAADIFFSFLEGSVQNVTKSKGA
jgi:hypothetical protein